MRKGLRHPPARAGGQHADSIREVLREHGTVERVDLGRATGLDQGSFAAVLGAMLDGGEVVEPSSGRFTLAPDKRERQARRQRAPEHLRMRGEQRASDADTDPEVEAVRRQLLGGQLLDPDDVPAWIEGQRRADEPVEYLRLGPPAAASPGREMIAGRPIIGYERPPLAYAGPGYQAVRRISSTLGLEPLRRLSEKLAKRYGWQPAQATVYVLTGAIPINGTRLTVRHTFPTPGGPTRWTVDFDSDEDPEVIADVIRKAQREHRIPRRRKVLDAERLAELRTFVAEHGSGEGARRAWNEQHPQFAYATRQSFGRAAARASR